MPKSAAKLTIATWNINSVRLRMAQVARFAQEQGVDVICLQEIKCRDGEFPLNAFRDIGFRHIAIQGQKGYHGVAVVSRKPLVAKERPPLCRANEARALAVEVAGVEVHCLYVPAGGDVPDPDENPKFSHKLDFVARMGDYYAQRARDPRLVIVGDLNIAPLEHDVWSHKQLLDVVSHTPVETEALSRVLAASGMTDLMRQAMPEPEKLFTWWSYRSPDWKANNRGRRLDHIWASPDLAEPTAAQGRDAISIHTACRDWEKPSDHVPVVARLRL